MSSDIPRIPREVMRAWAAAIRPRARIRPSDWAEHHRVLGRDQTSLPGPWRHEHAPYLRLIEDLPLTPGVSEVVIAKPAQSGVSEALRNVIGYLADHEPDPVGLALPSQNKGRRIVRNRVIPMFEQTAVLRDLLTTRDADVQSEQITLRNGFRLHLMWAGSATSMASDPMRVTIADEVEKFEEWVGEEADPLSLIDQRRTTYGQRAIGIAVSTPTTRFGLLWSRLEQCGVQLRYHVPCPSCGQMQELLWPRLRWERRDDLSTTEYAQLLASEGGVWYECIACGYHITEAERRGMILAGRWRNHDGRPLIDARGREHDCAETITEWPRGTRIGMQFSALIVLWVRWRDLASEFVRAKSSMSRMYAFVTNRLGQPWDERVSGQKRTVFERLCEQATLDEGVVPDWATTLLATIDTQHDHFWVVLRAWGPGMRSQRVWHGRVESFAELDELLFRHPWRRESDQGVVVPRLVLIDAGGTQLEGDDASRTMQVYRWVLPRQARVRAIRGASRRRAGQFIWLGTGLMRGQRRGRGTEIRLWFLDTHHFADELADMIASGADDPAAQRWLLNRRNDPVYNEHLSNATKILVRRGAHVRAEWVPIHRGARVDLWDCEVYQVAAAYMAQMHTLAESAPDGASEIDDMSAILRSRRRARRRRIGVMSR